MTARWLFVLGFATAVLASFGCGGGGDDGTTPPALACSDGGTAAANTVIMDCAGATDGTTELVNVVMGGPATGTTDLRGFNFDVLYDPTKLEFVPAATYTSPLFAPNALVAVTLENGVPGKVVVAIQQVDGEPDVSIPPGQSTVLSLSFRTVAGLAVPPTPVTFDPSSSEATPPTPPTTPVAITFSSSLMLSYQ